jgi:hypothetical protein
MYFEKKKSLVVFQLFVSAFEKKIFIIFIETAL